MAESNSSKKRKNILRSLDSVVGSAFKRSANYSIKPNSFTLYALDYQFMYTNKLSAVQELIFDIRDSYNSSSQNTNSMFDMSLTFTSTSFKRKLGFKPLIKLSCKTGFSDQTAFLEEVYNSLKEKDYSVVIVDSNSGYIKRNYRYVSTKLKK